MDEDRREDATDDSVLSYLSFTQDEVSVRFSRTMNARRRLQRPTSSMQGVLWKRRDVFRNRWRPRWFVLHPQQGILTYYLLNGNPQPPSNITTADVGSPVNRRRADSDISMDTIDYDVVPRGSIFLGNPLCTVDANETLTRVEERLYALTIADRETGTYCHLACRSSTARDRWLEKIQEAIAIHQTTSSQGSVINSDDDAVERAMPTASDTMPPEQVPNENDYISSIEKWSTVTTPDLTRDVHPSIIAKIESLLETNLPYAMETDHPDFRFSCETEGVKIAKHKSLPLIRSFYSAKDHHPANYLGLAWDFSQMSELQPNVRTQESLRSLNKHTSFVYTAFHPIWPSTPRDFAFVAHWRLLQNSKQEMALCLVAFSCPEANMLKPIQSNHVRGILNVSLHVWQPIQGGGCTHTRLLSFDMNGKLPNQLVQTIHHQQATFTPRAMDFYLQRVKSQAQVGAVAPNVCNMDYEAIISAIDKSKKQNKPELRHGVSVVVPSSRSKEEIFFKEKKDVSLLAESLVLMAPLALQKLLSVVDEVPRVELTGFCVAVVFCIRWVLLQHLLRFYHLVPLRSDRVTPTTGKTTVCRAVVDITTLQTFLENERQAKMALCDPNLSTVQVNHVLIHAISKAIHKFPILATRWFPLLPPLYNLNIEWQHLPQTAPLWIPSDQQSSIQSIADFCVTDDGRVNQSKLRPLFFLNPACRVYTSSQEAAPIESRSKLYTHVIDASCPCPIFIMVYPVAVRGLKTPVTDVQQGALPESILELSFTFQSTAVETCRSFVEEIARSIQHPELFDP